MAKFNNLIQLVQNFPDEKSCRIYLEQKRWKGKPTCPHCKHSLKIYRFSDGKRYKCGACRKKFTVTVGTIFENSNIPLQKWFIAIYLATAHKKGISSLQLSRDLEITQKSAWHMLHRIREMLKRKAPHMLSGTIEVDETLIGGKYRNRHKAERKSGSQGRSLIDKTPVLGMLERNGEVVSQPIADVTSKTIVGILRQNIRSDASLFTDAFKSYRKIGDSYHHEIVDHSIGEYSRNGVHTNTIEGYWSLLKRGILGIYHHVSLVHLHRYCVEFDFRYNTRKYSESDRFDLSLTQCNGTRLRYKDLIQSIN